MKQYKLVIADTPYREDKIVSLSTHRKLFDGSPSVGNCCCGELNCTLTIPTTDIPRNAKLVPYVSDDGETWFKKGEYFVFSREVDKVTGWVSIVAYDAIFRASAYFTEPGNIGTWPRVDIVVMRQIANKTQSELSPSVSRIMQEAYAVQYPGIKIEDGEQKPGVDGVLTMRDMAGRIASYYGGNWIIDNDGKWRLILLGDIAADADYLVTENSEAIVMGNTRILVR